MRDFFYSLKWKNKLDITDVVENLKHRKHIPSKTECPACSSDMVMHKDSSRADAFRWVCRRCRKRKPIRQNTWSSKYRIHLITLIMIIRYYVEDCDYKIAAKRTQVDEDLCLKIYEDLDSYKFLYIKKMEENLNGENEMCLNLIEERRNDFRKLSQLFTLPKVYDIVLETLNELFSTL